MNTRQWIHLVISTVVCTVLYYLINVLMDSTKGILFYIIFALLLFLFMSLSTFFKSKRR